MILNKLEVVIINANNEYFLERGYITNHLYRKVLNWLGSGKDIKTERIVLQWMESDANWILRVRKRMALHFWYILPVVILGFYLIRRMLLSHLKEGQPS